MHPKLALRLAYIIAAVALGLLIYVSSRQSSPEDSSALTPTPTPIPFGRAVADQPLSQLLSQACDSHDPQLLPLVIKDQVKVPFNRDATFSFTCPSLDPPVISLNIANYQNAFLTTTPPDFSTTRMLPDDEQIGLTFPPRPPHRYGSTPILFHAFKELPTSGGDSLYLSLTREAFSGTEPRVLAIINPFIGPCPQILEEPALCITDLQGTLQALASTFFTDYQGSGAPEIAILTHLQKDLDTITPVE